MKGITINAITLILSVVTFVYYAINDYSVHRMQTDINKVAITKIKEDVIKLRIEVSKSKD